MTTRLASSVSMPEIKATSVLRDLFSLTKPRLSSLVIFTSALGLFLAPGNISFFTGFISILATSGLVGGGCAINCWMEKDIDAMMERTKNRALPSGRLSSATALTFGLTLITICLAALYLLVNPLTALLGFTAATIYLFFYTPMKRKTSLALFAGAIPGAIPPLMGWTSVTGSIGELGLALFAILFIWQLPHFLSISIYHAQDYNNAEIKTLPANIGFRGTLHRIVLYTFAMLFVCLIPYYIGAANESYRNAIILLGGAYFVFSLRGYFIPQESKEFLQWARQYFYGSLVYLPCVFVLMLCFR
jgi:protoheme IX farnesyltransferase